jgi:hypothetical protein
MAARSPGEGRTLAPGLRASAAVLAGMLALAWASPAQADDEQALEMAKSPFDNGQYLEAHTRLSPLLDPSLPPCDGTSGTGVRCHLTSPDLLERARALDAASLLALKRDAEADVLIGAIFRQNPNYVPSPAMFPQEVIDRFNAVRSSLSTELRAIAQRQAQEAEQKRLATLKARDDEEKWIADLQHQAGRERLVESNSRWLALVPFGIGQFQNGDIRLGITFAVGEVLLGAGSLVSLVFVNNLTSSANGRLPNSPAIDYPTLNANLATGTLVNRISFGAWTALTLAGVIQAQVAFVPEKITYRDRPIPPRPKLVPVAVPVTRGAVLGFGGTF